MSAVPQWSPTDAPEDRSAGRGTKVERLVSLLPAGITVCTRPGETIVDAIRRQGYRTRYKCRRGGCGVCRASLVSGSVRYPGGVCEEVLHGDGTVTAGDVRGEACLPCRAVPETDVVVELGPTDRVVDVLGTLLSSEAGRSTAGKTGVEGRNRQCPS